jgi:hypothetical protein
MRGVAPVPPPTVPRAWLARWRRGTTPLHGAFVACDVCLALPVVAIAGLVWWSGALPWWGTALATLAALTFVETAVREVTVLRRASRG